MPATWMREVALMLFVWLMAHHYQNWGVMGVLRKTRFQLQVPEVEKETEKAEKEFQGLTVKPVRNACEHAEELPVMLRVPPLIEHKKGRHKSVQTGLQFCPNKKCDYYG